MSEVKVVPISLDQASVEQSSSLFVVNRTAPLGNLNLQVNDGLGNSYPVRIPVTWIPFDLSTQAPKEAVLRSPHVRKLVNSRVLTLVSADSARKAIDSNPEAQEEARKLYAAMAQTNGESQAAELVLSATSAAQSVEIQAAMADAKMETGLEEDGLSGVNPTAYNIAMSEDLTEDQALSMLRGQASAFSKEDFSYVALKCKHARVKEEAAKFAKQ